jgi:MSHA biogenesis protein MshK
MVEALKMKVKLFAVQGVLLMLAQLMVGSVYAEQLLDPTRPADLGGHAQSGAASTGPVLQSVLISPQRRVAIISGKTLTVGEKFGESRIVSITESEVVMQNGKAMQTLKLFPDVQKRLTSGSVNTKTDHRRQ